MSSRLKAYKNKSQQQIKYSNTYQNQTCTQYHNIHQQLTIRAYKSCRRISALNFQEPAQNVYFWTQNRKNRHLKKLIGVIWQNSLNFYMFYGILSKLLWAKFSVRKFACAKKFTFKTFAHNIHWPIRIYSHTIVSPENNIT